MSDIPGYDAWKLASPPEYETRDTCPRCGEQEGFSGNGCACGWSADDEEDAHDRWVDQKIAEWKERER